MARQERAGPAPNSALSFSTELVGERSHLQLEVRPTMEYVGNGAPQVCKTRPTQAAAR